MLLRVEVGWACLPVVSDWNIQAVSVLDVASLYAPLFLCLGTLAFLYYVLKYWRSQ